MALRAAEIATSVATRLFTQGPKYFPFSRIAQALARGTT
jgi:hypothetical protein